MWGSPGHGGMPGQPSGHSTQPPSALPPLPDGPGAEGSDQPHLRYASPAQEEAVHLLQHLPPALQLCRKWGHRWGWEGVGGTRQAPVRGILNNCPVSSSRAPGAWCLPARGLWATGAALASPPPRLACREAMPAWLCWICSAWG